MKCLFPLSLLVFVSVLSAKDFELYLLAGQSNMEGFGYVQELPDGYSEVPGAMIFHGNMAKDGEERDGRGIWSQLRAGHGIGFASDGEANQYSNRFGPELSFAKTLRNENPDTQIAIIKYARGGTALDENAARHSGTWGPHAGNGEGINQYDHCLATIRRALSVSDIDGDGEMDTLVPAGIVWMQGESDGNQLGPATRYAENLKEIVALFRAALRDDDLPVVIGRISDSGRDEDGLVWNFGNVVREQQQEYCDGDANATLVTSTDAYAYSDKWHYDSAGFLDLGEQFAKAMLELQK